MASGKTGTVVAVMVAKVLFEGMRAEDTIMKNDNQLRDEAGYKGFEFDYNRNVIFDHGNVIRLAPHESDILKTLLDNRGRPTPMSTLIAKVYGIREPDAAAISIRVAIHTLRKKIKATDMAIRVEPSVGYEIDASRIPELNRRLTDKILLALNLAQAHEEPEVAHLLEQALALAAKKRAETFPANNTVQFPAALAA
jgi:DNA-binding winged helix-turn-helix (wHTH) protein